MPSIVDTLEQDEWWYAQDGLPVRLADMELEYLENLLAYLRRGADRLWRHRLWAELSPLFVRLGYGRRDAAQLIAETLDRWSYSLPEPPEAWLERRPLVARLQHLILEYGTLEGELVPEPAAVEVESPLWRALERGR